MTYYWYCSNPDCTNKTVTTGPRNCYSCKKPLTEPKQFEYTKYPLWIGLTKEEARAIIKELGATFIDRDNPLCNEVLTKLMRFVND